MNTDHNMRRLHQMQMDGLPLKAACERIGLNYNAAKNWIATWRDVNDLRGPGHIGVPGDGGWPHRTMTPAEFARAGRRLRALEACR